MISKDPRGSGPEAITIRSWTGLIARMLLALLVCTGVFLFFAWYVSVIAGCIVAALEGILLLYRARRHGVCFDDRGITVRNFYRTHELSWHDVSRFTDGKVFVGAGEYSEVFSVRANRSYPA